jgi:NAD(P)-dependent dehydrogenase (short-subunit alcohol dehydrogenase family)
VGWRTNKPSKTNYDTQEDFRMAKALRVLITGAARGIGMATAQVLANRGHSVVATDISPVSGLEGIQAHVLDVTSDDPRDPVCSKLQII